MKKLIVTAMAALSFSAYADFKNGNKLYNQMISSDSIDNMVALGYVTGIIDAYSGVLICLNDGVTAGQVNDVVKQYLFNNPAIRDKAASILVNNAISPIWPCQKKSKNERTL